MTDLGLLKRAIQGDSAVKGLKIDDQAIRHLGHLLDIWETDTHGRPNDTIQSMRFYCMGYAAGVQSQAK